MVYRELRGFWRKRRPANGTQYRRCRGRPGPGQPRESMKLIQTLGGPDGLLVQSEQPGAEPAQDRG